eukprot:1190912-Prorocentrum_minimum.AAC.3
MAAMRQETADERQEQATHNQRRLEEWQQQQVGHDKKHVVRVVVRRTSGRSRRRTISGAWRSGSSSRRGPSD